MKTIQPCLWFDGQAEEAAKFYAATFRNARVDRIVRYGPAGAKASGQREGAVMTAEFQIEGLSFLGLNGGPHFELNPSVSFFVGCDDEAEIDHLWRQLNQTPRMDLGKYPWAEKYGWCRDRFGVDWQLMLGQRPQKVMPSLLFVNERFGKAAEAIDFYTSVFPRSQVETIARDEKTQTVLHAVFSLSGQAFAIGEGPGEHRFSPTPAHSFVIYCESQAELDDFWRKLSAVPQAEQCGWLQDKYGVSWQVVHKDWGKWLAESDPATQDRMMSAVLKMKKPDLAVLEQAYRGTP